MKATPGMSTYAFYGRSTNSQQRYAMKNKRKYVLGAVRRRRRAFLLRSITECGAKQKGGTEPPRG